MKIPDKWPVPMTAYAQDGQSWRRAGAVFIIITLFHIIIIDVALVFRPTGL